MYLWLCKLVPILGQGPQMYSLSRGGYTGFSHPAENARSDWELFASCRREHSLIFGVNSPQHHLRRGSYLRQKKRKLFQLLTIQTHLNHPGDQYRFNSLRRSFHFHIPLHKNSNSQILLFATLLTRHWVQTSVTVMSGGWGSQNREAGLMAFSKRSLKLGMAVLVAACKMSRSSPGEVSWRGVPLLCASTHCNDSNAVLDWEDINFSLRRKGRVGLECYVCERCHVLWRSSIGSTPKRKVELAFTYLL